MRRQIFQASAAVIFRRPFWIFGIALLLTVVSAGLSENLKMQTRVLDLLPGDDPAAIEFNDIVHQYSTASQIIVGIEGDDRNQMIAVAEEIKRRAHEAKYKDSVTGKPQKFIKRVDARLDTDFLAKHGLMLAKKKDLENFDELYQDLRIAPFLAAFNDFLEREYVEDSSSVTEREKEDTAINSLKGLMIWLDGLRRTGLEQTDDKSLKAHVDLATDLLSISNPYFFSDDDKMLLIMAHPAISLDRMEEIMDGVASLRDVIKDINKDYPQLKVSMTGMPVLSLEETEVTMEDMGAASLISLLLVLLLFILAFRMWTAPLLAMITLLMGVAWTSGFIALTFGRLNLFTLMFVVILIGLGIDFSIHLNAAFAAARSEGKSLEEALKEMYRRAGNGVITGAVTTAAAFFALALTGLEAFIELGVVLGAGILFTMLSAMLLLPALFVMHIRIAEKFSKRNGAMPNKEGLAFPFLADMGRQISRAPFLTLVISLLLTGILVWLGTGAQFEKDMLEIEPPDMPSVLLHKEVLKRFEVHPDYSLVTTKDLEETRSVVKKLKKNRLVGRVDAITEFLPSEQQQKIRAPMVERIGRRMEALVLPEPNPTPSDSVDAGPTLDNKSNKDVPQQQVKQLNQELDRLQMNIQELGTLAYTSVKMRLFRYCESLAGDEEGRGSKILALKQKLGRLKDLAQTMADYQQAYLPLLAAKLSRMADTSPITLESLPDSITDRYLSKEGSNLITIYASVDLWHEDKLDLFVAAMDKISDRVTGTVTLMNRLIDLISQEGLVALMLAFGAILVILFIDFRHLGYVLLGTVPLLTGFIWMVGLFVLAGYKFDVANVMALPLILGIGIDDAVHVLHATRRLGIDALPEILRNTGRALVLTSLTTAIAFGSIAFSSHRGMAGMGLLLLLGVGSCLITSLILLPALMRIFFRSDKSKQRKEKVQNVQA